MRLKILTYVPPGKGKKGKNSTEIKNRRTDETPELDKPIKQYRRRKLPYISPDLRWMCLWIVLLLVVTLVMSVIDTGAL